MNRIYIAIRWRFLFIFNQILFKKFGKKSVILNSLKIEGHKNIEIGENVFIGYKSWISSISITSDNSKLVIGNGSKIGNFNHIYATRCISIGENVLTADKVYISDNLHNYEDITTPIVKQSLKQVANVFIGDGSWLGENVCIIGASIGKNCVVGANSVVTRNIPDYCIVVGAPATIIKRYCFDSASWKKTDEKGNFLA
ncbi:acyltransferase [Flavobacterium soyae]|uniref:acyltransferase n=1 Tax=Flavobacterium soyae TaxID=2903098 RepID=UPI001E409F01|nr:acyltransferase [Flavobacterium soyae]MCD9575247.1 acyltransferase [Flavobacterium soyae]